ncbi:MAG: thioester reductase domain-containing protein [Pseudodesulfovibrio sp.]|nr:thioester reductase domain-containing protein [Pseudodesulfovibrio sp.]
MTNNSNGILLTGATGFLGAYLLKELLNKTTAPIYCLARPNKETTAEKRLLENMQFLFGTKEINAWDKKRIVAIEGDVGKENLDLSQQEYDFLCKNVNSIFHSAAMMWHFGRTEIFEQVNVGGVKRLLALAGCGIPKTINHISTLAVSGRRCDNPENRFSEADFHENMNCPNAYVQTKFEAEKLLRRAMSEGHDIKIFRPGFIMGDTVTGRFKKQITVDAQYLQLRGHILMQTAPPLYPDDYMDVTPVDYTAKAIVHIALNPDAENGVYHTCNPSPILKSDVWDIIRDYGYQIHTIPADNYMEKVLMMDDNDAFLEGLKDVIVYLDDYEKSPAIFECTRTLNALDGSGIHCHAPTRELLYKYLDYCVNIEFLPAPGNPNPQQA